MIKTEVIPLGTSSATPTRERWLSATALQRGGRILLFDCGEATQFRLMAAGLSPARIDTVLITHLHGDHFFGLPGLLTSLSLNHRKEPLTIVGPRPLTSVLTQIPGLGVDELSFTLHFVELESGEGRRTVVETPDFTVEARPIQHRVPAWGYRFQEQTLPGNLDAERARSLGATEHEQFRRLKSGSDITLSDGRIIRSADVVSPPAPGASFAYVFDTRPCDQGVQLAREADLVYHDATFASEHAERAVRTGHSTAAEAARVAADAGARKLLLGHFSARYQSTDILVREARRVFENSHAAEELKRVLVRQV